MKRSSTFHPFPSRVSTAHLCILLFEFGFQDKWQVALSHKEAYKPCNKNYFTKYTLHRMIIVVLSDKTVLKGSSFLLVLFQLWTHVIVKTFQSSTLQNIHRYQDCPSRLWTKGKKHPCAKTSEVGLQRGHPFQ